MVSSEFDLLWLTYGILGGEQAPLLALGIAALLAAIGELLHQRRTAKVAMLAFGPNARPALWTRLVGPLRVAAFGGLGWALVTLVQVEPKVHTGADIPDEEWRHLLLVYDVSPSMHLKDAGPNRDQTRHQRARELVESLFDRVQIGRFKVSVIATYNGAKPVVTDTKDLEVVRHMMSAVDLQYAFKVGKTRLFDGIAEAARIAKNWRVGSALMVIVTDGDTVPATGMPVLPPSIGGTLVVGVGDHLAGSFLAGQQSRQDESTLRQVAIRLSGEYHNGNRRHVPTDILTAATSDARKPLIERLTRREYALIVAAAASALLALLPLLLTWFGTRWRPGTRTLPARS